MVESLQTTNLVGSPRQKFLSGISLAALLVPLALFGTPAAAEDNVAFRELYGEEGTAADAHIIGTNKQAGAGTPGGGISVTNSFTKDTTTGTAVRLGSMGGRGGRGDVGRVVFDFAWEYGGRGGAGGDVTLVQTGALAGKGDQAMGAAMPTDAKGLCRTVYSPGNWAGDPCRNPSAVATYLNDRWTDRGGALILLYSQGGRSGAYQSSISGAGGDGGAVTATLDAAVATDGKNYAGLWARSLGGYSADGSIESSDKATLKGGKGGTVKVTVQGAGSVSTSGASSPGIFAESVGGRGSATSRADYNNRAPDGGDGGAVTFRNAGLVKTTGDYSASVILQSVGGTGGAVNGGTGGDGGAGGTVSAINASSLSTTGKYSFALLAQSSGGGGGIGADGIVAGNQGGSAGAGGLVRVGNFGTVRTEGEGATGIVAQSVGGGNAIDAFQVKAITPGSNAGGGGAGGWGLISGGAGGNGGAGGDVRVVQNGTISTSSADAYGLVAQSIGGGGGNGGASGNITPFLGISLGGRGGGGGDGGNVSVINSRYLPGPDEVLTEGRDWAYSLQRGIVRDAPAITTSGKGASALVAMSVGGGGGVGGSASAKSGGIVGSVSVAVGGAGGDGGNGGTVKVGNESAIITTGVEANGILAKSVGGGGGIGGNASAYSLAVAPPNYPAVSLSFAVGGAGGKGGNGGAVTVDNYAGIATFGSSSDAIEAMSVGGGGGSGGTAKSVSDAISLYTSVTVAAALGGSGGDGGSGGGVTVDNRNSLETSGAFSKGIFAQSVGGGGGKGGTGDVKTSTGISWNDFLDTAVSILPKADAYSANIAMGGTGGVGGSGGAVTVNNYGSILTRNVNSKGIHAQSVGGGGGDAGGYLAAGGGSGLSGTLEMGGGAGKKDPDGNNKSGGDGGAVTVTNARNATIETRGAGSVGIFAQSVGGGGGDGGGFAGTVKAPVNFSDSPVKYLVQLADEILQVKDVADYVKKVASSPSAKDDKGAASKDAVSQEDKKLVEGGLDDKKKKDGMSVDDKVKYAKTVLKIVKNGVKAYDAEKSFADANNGEFSLSPLLLNIEADLVTIFKDDVKKAIKDQGFKDRKEPPKVDITVALGGKGGTGGVGGTVKVFNYGDLTTGGDNSIGLLVQSVGGGGGRGGAALATGNNTLNANISFGATGGDGGNGGFVEVTNGGTLTTSGGGAFGLFAQSVGGGGGYGGVAASANSISLTANVKVGGSGGKSSDGGGVKVDNSGTITTLGKEAHALIAQSVGGGGGTLFVSRVDPVGPESLATSADMAEALTLANDLLKTVSGNTLKSSSATTEQKSNAQKIADLLQQDAVGSMGGGTSDVSTTILPTPTIGASFGGDGGKGGSGGNVDVIHSGTVSTEGLGAFGIFAQSVGGGGGFGADSGQNGLLNFELRLGGTGGTAGNGGKVHVDLKAGAKVTTSGDGAHAVFIQSIGGGGGYSGAGLGAPRVAVQSPTQVSEQYWVSLPPIIGPNGMAVPQLPYLATRTVTKILGAGGDGGAITVDGAEKILISTTGKQAHGIFAQSLGAGGGATFVAGAANLPAVSTGQSRDAYYMTGKGGDITVDTKGEITATGVGAYGLYLQSGVQKTDGVLDPSRLGGTIKVTHNGTITGGSGDGAAIRIDGGRIDDGGTNTLEFGAGSMVSAASGTAILGSFGKETVKNYGTIVGDINLVNGGSAEINTFGNLGSGIYQSRVGNGIINLGPSGTFTNTGVLDIAGVGKMGTLTVSAWLVELGGVMRVDVNSLGTGAARNDRLDVHGVLDVKGVAIQPRVAGGLVRNDPFEIITTTGYRASGPTTVSVNPASPVSWTVSAGETTVLRPASANFAQAAQREMTPTEMNMVSGWQQAWDSGNTNKALLFGKLANVTSVADYQAAIESASPEGQQQPAVGQTLNAPRSMTSAMSCPIFIDSGTIINESECMWSRVTGSRTSTFDSPRTDGFTEDAVTFRMGAQWEIKPDWFFGASVGYISTTGNSSDNYTNINGTGGDISLALKHQVGPWLFAGAVHLGYGNNSIASMFDVGDAIWSATASSKVWTAAVRGRAAYEFAFSDWYVRPFVDLDLIYTTMSGYTLPGDVFTLEMGRMSEWTFAVHPAIEVGARIDLGPGSWLRPYASAGITYLSNNGLSTQVALYDGQPDGFSFTSTAVLPDFLFDVGGGLQFLAMDKYELRGEYKAQIGDQFLSHEASLRLSTRF